MKKKVVVCAMLLSMTCLLGACGDSAKTIEKAPAQSSTTQTQNVSEGQTSTAANVDFGYVFEANGGKVAPQMLAEECLAGLGEPVNKFEAASCAFEGLDIIYTYSGFEVDTSKPQGEVETVLSVIIKDDTVATPEGLTIADAEAKIEEAYGAPTSKDGDKYTYEKGVNKLVIIVNGGQVASIEYAVK